MESKIQVLGNNNTNLKDKIKDLQIENRVLKAELLQFRNLIEHSNLGQAFKCYNTKSTTQPATSAAPANSNAVVAATPATAPPVPNNGIQLSDVILKAMSGGTPNKEGIALVLYLLMALHSYGQYWNQVTAHHQIPVPAPEGVSVEV